jgi:hypothetical protein
MLESGMRPSLSWSLGRSGANVSPRPVLLPDVGRDAKTGGCKKNVSCIDDTRKPELDFFYALFECPLILVQEVHVKAPVLKDSFLGSDDLAIQIATQAIATSVRS